MRPSDRLGRPLRDLRVSVTDRCNFRCGYCMPREAFGPGHAFLPRHALLTFEEITRIVRVTSEIGVTKVRLTGGEPLLRRNLTALVEQIAVIPAVSDLALTTNGALLAQHARALRNAGLHRVTVSLDSLDDDVFRRMNDVDIPVHRVLDGIEAAAGAGLHPIKLNAVIRRGVNEAGVLDLVRYAREQGHTLRLIEYMDVGTTNGWRPDQVVAAATLVARIDAEFGAVALAPGHTGEVARRYAYGDGRGEFGVIASVTQPFCGDCTRARLSTDGRLFTCLFAAGGGTDLRAILREGGDDHALRLAVASAWLRRDDRYSEDRGAITLDAPRLEMSYIGG